MRLDTSGLNELSKALLKLGSRAQGAVKDMLEAGGEKGVEAWKASAQQHGHVRTGAMVKSIKADKPKVTGSKGSLEIYPRGTDHKVRNAEKAFILHYGTSKITGDHWVDDADRQTEETAVPAMAAQFDKYLKKEGF